MSILAILERQGTEWHRLSWETLAAAQQIGREMGEPVQAAVIGEAGELASKQLERAYAVEHALVGEYTADGYALAFRQLIERCKPRLVLLPHTYQVRDFAPKLATALDRVLVSDVIGHRVEDGDLIVVRQLSDRSPEPPCSPVDRTRRFRHRSNATRYRRKATSRSASQPTL